MGNICGKFFSCTLCVLQIFQLFLDLSVLLIQPKQQRPQFFIADIVQRLFQINLIDRFDELLCLVLYQKKLDYKDHTYQPSKQ